MTLGSGAIGGNYIVKGLNLQGKIEKRLEALGLIYGTKVIVLNSKKNGSIIFKVRGTRLAVGKEIAQAIEIDKEDTN